MACWKTTRLVRLFSQQTSIYPLVNIQKTMGNQHFLWENQLFLWPFSIANCWFTGVWGEFPAARHVNTGGYPFFQSYTAGWVFDRTKRQSHPIGHPITSHFTLLVQPFY